MASIAFSLTPPIAGWLADACIGRYKSESDMLQCLDHVDCHSISNSELSYSTFNWLVHIPILTQRSNWCYWLLWPLDLEAIKQISFSLD